ncbi:MULTISPECIES: ParB/RepB/Spo0J family partition protein [Alteribacter]|uniref:ParB/RepB/Spo0J family partition protein n=1 Tax=Alteribacter keqinensis TaxID=2483800 RepID=A0A3M7TRB6_9BACI|nr:MULTISPECIES: ParB/RepB/Spo0J family partition protein [Alteribacter]MBM7095374.1 ParB/RepB/Spo0J family partition protein [Alteribacter salitolerans]RNA68015.1 ParB/RepB/Spo0J family partition protein [Alteribacter keqinensis]
MGKGLGRGIQALFPDDEKQEKVDEISISELRPNPYQPRKQFSDEAIDELKTSIAQHGVLQPIIVRKSIKGYEIVVGERRFRAARAADLKTIPAVVRQLTEDEMMEIALIENIQREDLNALEEAKAYQKLMEHLQITQDELAKKLGKSRPHIANHLRLLQLPQLAQQFLAEGKLSMGHGRALLGLKNKEQIPATIQKVVNEKLSVRQLEEYVQKVNVAVSRETKDKKKQVSPFVREREASLKKYFGTNVQIKQGKKKGKIEIDFFSEDDLDRILTLLDREG